MPVTSPENTLAYFDQRATASNVLNTLMSLAEVGGRKSFDVSLDVELVSADEGYVYFDSSRPQNIKISTYGGSTSSSFKFGHPGYGREVSCSVIDVTEDNKRLRYRIETGEAGEPELVMAQCDANWQYVDLSREPADVGSIYFLARKALSTAIDRPLLAGEPKHGVVNKLLMGRSDILDLSQKALVPQLFKSLASTGEILRAGGEDVKVNAAVVLYSAPALIYSASVPLTDSNAFNVRAMDRDRQVGSHLRLGARPLGSTEYAMAYAKVRVENRKEAAYTVDTLMQGRGELVRVRTQAEWGGDPVEVGSYPATIDTISELAKFAAQVAKGGSTEWLE